MVKQVGIEESTILLEQQTRLTSYGKIPLLIQKAVNGAISALIYGKEKEKRDLYYKSSARRSNDEALVLMASQVYSYLNGAISSIADVNEYAFRIWTRATIRRSDGRIMNEPLFDVEIFKYVGRVSAQSREVKDYSLALTFVGKKDDRMVTPSFSKLLTKLKASAKYIRVDAYPDMVSAPRDLRDCKVKPPFIAVDQEVFGVRLKTNPEDELPTIYLDDTQPVDISDANDLFLFLTEKTGLEPTILGLSTGFQPVDAEVLKLSGVIAGTAKKKGSDLLPRLDLENALEKIRASLKPIRERELPPTHIKSFEAVTSRFEKLEKKYEGLVTQYEVAKDMLSDNDKKFKREQITNEVYRVNRVKSLGNLKAAERALVGLQNEVKLGFNVEIGGFLSSLERETAGEKLKA